LKEITPEGNYPSRKLHLKEITPAGNYPLPNPSRR